MHHAGIVSSAIFHMVLLNTRIIEFLGLNHSERTLVEKVISFHVVITFTFHDLFSLVVCREKNSNSNCNIHSCMVIFLLYETKSD